jgi:NTE family protein
VPEQRIPVALVLGSGGARGLAHAGVIRALQDCGRFEIRSITGSSIGALIGGLHAGGKLDAYVDWVSGLSRGDVWKLLDFSFTGRGLFEGDRLMQKLSDLVGDARIEDLDIPFTAVASDIERRREVWITRGSLFEAIRASIAIPGFFTPVVLGGRLLVDGGLLSPLPIAPAQRHDVERIIAVSLNGIRAAEDRGPGEEAADPAGTQQPEAGLIQRWITDARETLGLGTSDTARSDNVFETILRSLEAMQDRIARYQIAAHGPDILVEIPADACGTTDFHLADEIIELGYRRARAALDRDINGEDAGRGL